MFWPEKSFFDMKIHLKLWFDEKNSFEIMFWSENLFEVMLWLQNLFEIMYLFKAYQPTHDISVVVQPLSTLHIKPLNKVPFDVRLLLG